jgi:hypothetical protein
LRREAQIELHYYFLRLLLIGVCLARDFHTIQNKESVEWKDLLFGHSRTLPGGSRKATWLESDALLPKPDVGMERPPAHIYRTAAWSMAALKGWCATVDLTPSSHAAGLLCDRRSHGRAAAASPLCCLPGSRRQNRLRSNVHQLYPRVAFIVTNLSRPAERVVPFYNQRGTCGQWIKEGKGPIKWTRLSCRSFAVNAVRRQLHALAYNRDNFMRTLAMPKAAEPWSLTSLREKLIKIGAKVVSHGLYGTFQLAEVAVSRQMFADILMLIARLRAPPAPA